MRVVIGVLTLLFAFASAVAEESVRFSFAALGCMPYGEESWPGFERAIGEINRHAPAFSVHCGDTKRSVDPPSDAHLERLHAAFGTFAGPLIYTPGDNEWTDVHREAAGGHDPLVWLGKLREKFFPLDQSLGGTPLPLIRQSADRRFASYVENARWSRGGVTFATVHVVGSNNGNLPNVPGAVAEFQARNAANIVWIQEVFAGARKAEAKGLALFFHGDIFAEDFGRAHADSGHSEFIAALEAEALAFTRPVLLVHSDEHRYRLEKDVRLERDRPRLPNVTRLETFGAVNLHAVLVTVDPRSAEVFLAGPLLVPGNALPVLP